MFSKFLDFFYFKKDDVENYLSELFSATYVRFFIIAIIAINIIIWVIVHKAVVLAGADNIALHYNVEKGIDLYGEAKKLYILPIFGLFVFILNFLILSFINNKKDRTFIAYTLLGSAFFANIILVMAIISLYIVNFGQ
ncbi:hypothetical protein L6270_03675 [Candidatus Parcubacteria bacterium]|nr:hypothetical protein [Patescibacteria group bacterium]MBU4309062.1 hypothetical protein [Patescibacteria group bacterium]MBU4432439.1 hypothetical protein [Patescibacteria group bacterium]MBU4577423.1 hypothetical protein [Patescibacteria group bacterium]MCG2697111.1 hypothetical protein [Candidatus Parcubacteria bacterium]